MSAEMSGLEEKNRTATVKPGTFELRFDANHARIVRNLEKWLRSHRA